MFSTNVKALQSCALSREVNEELPYVETLRDKEEHSALCECSTNLDKSHVPETEEMWSH